MIHQTKTPPAGAHCTHKEGPQRIGDASPARLAKRHTGIGTPHTHNWQSKRNRTGGDFRMEHVRENPSARPANKERRSQSSSTLNPPEQRRVTLAGQTSVTRARIQQRQFRTGQTRSRRFAQLFRCPPRFVRRRYSATNFLPHPFKTASAERPVVRRYESNDARKAAGDLGKPSRVHVTPIVRQQRETRDRER